MSLNVSRRKMSFDINGIVRSRRKCCVYGCTNNEMKNRNLKFYSFPGRKWEIERKLKWIDFVRKAAPSSKKSWLPTANSRICSSHFIGGEKSNNMNNISYIPTLLPGMHEDDIMIPVQYAAIKVEPDTDDSDTKDPLQITTRDESMNCDMHTSTYIPQNCILFQENKDGITVKMEVDPDATYRSILELDPDTAYRSIPHVTLPPPPIRKKKMVSIGLQTDASINVPTSDMDILFCMSKDNNVLIQTNIVIRNPVSAREKKVIVIDRTVKTEDKRCGSDNESFPGFAGMADIESDHVLKQFTGISRDLYNILVQKIALRKNGQPAFYKKIFKENRLLLSLMKFKMGLSFGALGCMFHIHASSASKVFSEVLQTLSVETESWITPGKVYYEQTEKEKRVVVEEPTESKTQVKVKVLMFTNYKGIVLKRYAVAFTYSGKIIRVWELVEPEDAKPTVIKYFGDNISFKHGDLFLVDYNHYSSKTNLIKTYNAVIDHSVDGNPELTEGGSLVEVLGVERSFHRLKSFRILNHISVDLIPSMMDIMHMSCVFANSKHLTLLNSAVKDPAV